MSADDPKCAQVRLLAAVREVVRADEEDGYPVGDNPYEVWRAISELKVALKTYDRESHSGAELGAAPPCPVCLRHLPEGEITRLEGVLVEDKVDELAAVEVLGGDVPIAATDFTCAQVYECSPSGASLTCRYCGTIYDNHPEVGYVPPVGDGCDMCSATEEELDALAG